MASWIIFFLFQKQFFCLLPHVTPVLHGIKIQSISSEIACYSWLWWHHSRLTYTCRLEFCHLTLCKLGSSYLGSFFTLSLDQGCLLQRSIIVIFQAGEKIQHGAWQRTLNVYLTFALHLSSEGALASYRWTIFNSIMFLTVY